jgi:hypothetical protein
MCVCVCVCVCEWEWDESVDTRCFFFWVYIFFNGGSEIISASSLK